MVSLDTNTFKGKRVFNSIFFDYKPLVYNNKKYPAFTKQTFSIGGL